MTADIGKRYTALLGAALVAALGLGVLGIAGCQRTTAAADPKELDSAQPEKKKSTSKEAGEASEAVEGVTLTAEEVENLGVATEPAQTTDYAAAIVGYGVVIPHDTVATAVAELATAKAAQEQSRAVAARAQRLAGTPGAMSAEAVESADRQVATGAAALALAEHRLSSVIGGGPPGGGAAGNSTLQDLASGKVKLVRATFPLGALKGASPASMRAARLDASSPDGMQSSPGWTLRQVWNAPADASLPGRSFFALLKDGDVSEGERLLVWAPGTGPQVRGVSVPAAAVVISNGRYWCYVEQKPGVYVRRAVATDRPIGAAYVVTQSIAAGDKIVTAAAALLLAREMNPSPEADSD